MRKVTNMLKYTAHAVIYYRITVHLLQSTGIAQISYVYSFAVDVNTVK